MSLSELLAGAIVIAKQATAGLQVAITHEPFEEDDAQGNRIYGTASTYMVIVEDRERYLTAHDRAQQLSKAIISFLEPVEIGQNDRITLPNGQQPQILSVEGVLDPTGKFYAPVVFF
jgi:hypothetical protein